MGPTVVPPRGQPRQPADRHSDPCRPIGRLVGNFVGGLFNQEQAEECVLGRAVLRAGSLPIGAQKCSSAAGAEL